MEALEKEALLKAEAFHEAIEKNESLCEILMETEEWHVFREVMIRLALS